MGKKRINNVNLLKVYHQSDGLIPPFPMAMLSPATAFISVLGRLW